MDTPCPNDTNGDGNCGTPEARAHGADRRKVEIHDELVAALQKIAALWSGQDSEEFDDMDGAHGAGLNDAYQDAAGIALDALAKIPAGNVEGPTSSPASYQQMAGRSPDLRATKST